MNWIVNDPLFLPPLPLPSLNPPPMCSGKDLKMSDWLLRKSFVMHSGAPSDFKIECNALTDEEIETFALLISKKFKFGGIRYIPTGGARIRNALCKYISDGPWIIVDDVLTTGWSMRNARTSPDDIGVVLFARGPCPEWVHPIFQLWGKN